jgi:hypothetical protein
MRLGRVGLRSCRPPGYPNSVDYRTGALLLSQTELLSAGEASSASGLAKQGIE